MHKISFSLAPTPILHAGPGKIAGLSGILNNYGKRILLITGEKSFGASNAHAAIFQQLNDGEFDVRQFKVEHEPSPAMVDKAVESFGTHNPVAILAVGGGSVMDAAKAISAMIPLDEPVKDYLEGVGSKVHPGVKIPFIAVPTTSGTGSESTRNAVLSEVGKHGYKKSMRHVNFISDAAILDANLMVSCPPNVTAYSGMDAFTQLLESYLSNDSNFYSDLLATEGLRHIAGSLRQAYEEGTDLDARSGMAIAAYLSGVTLTNVGLGLVHGLAGVIGGYKNIPHGVICSALMPSCNRITVRLLRAKASTHPALIKYSIAGKIFCTNDSKSAEYYTDYLLELMEQWVVEMSIPKLSAFGITKDDLREFAREGENKNNPVPLNTDEISEVLELSM